MLARAGKAPRWRASPHPFCWSAVARNSRESGQAMAMEFNCRRATIGDAAAVAEVFSASFRLLTFLPMLHSEDEDRRFIENVILAECEVTVAEVASAIVSFLARRDQ